MVFATFHGLGCDMVHRTNSTAAMLADVILPNWDMCLISKLVSPLKAGLKKKSTPGPGF
jgi:hypothetical protein